jgi:hypothetical protein
MRTTALRLTLLASLACAGMLAAHAQPQWRFHLAFEDGTGARDTLWFVYDTSATMPTTPWPGPNIDYALGEGPVDVSDGAFHVYLMNAAGEFTKTVARPYSWYPYMETGLIEGINWVPPMTIRWDTSLFHAPYLPYEQGSFGTARMDGNLFYGLNNDPMLQAYNMLIDDSVVVWELWDYLFPFGVLFEPGTPDPLVVNEPTACIGVRAWPNPAKTDLWLDGTSGLMDIVISDASGRIVRNMIGHESREPIDVTGLAPGSYMLKAVSGINNLQYHAKFQKIP